MLDVTVRVTKTPTHLEQIHHIGIVNKGRTGAGSGFYAYDLYLDGERHKDQVIHYREYGALELLKLALEHLIEKERRGRNDDHV